MLFWVIHRVNNGVSEFYNGVRFVEHRSQVWKSLRFKSHSQVMPSGNQGSTPCRSCSAESRSPLRHLRMTAECAWASFESALLPVQQTGKPVHTCHIRFKGCPSVLNTTLLKSIAGFGEKRRYRYFSVSAGKKLSILSNGVFPSTSTSSYSPYP